MSISEPILHRAAPCDTHEPVLPPVPLSSTSNVSGSAQQLLWLSTIADMRTMPEANNAQLDLITDWITNGVSLDFASLPDSVDFNNTYSVDEHASEVRQRLQEYIQLQAIVPLPSNHVCPFGIQPLHVIIKENKKPRLVIDLSRNLNKNLQYEYFHYSNLTEATEAAKRASWFVKLDLSNCYLSFPLHPSTYPHFIFSFEDHLYQFVRMPFGLCSAPRICTMLLSVLHHRITSECSSHLTALIRYLDDLLFITPSQPAAQLVLEIAQRVIQSFGLVVNTDKTEGPAQVISFLGVQLDSIHYTLSCTSERVQHLLLLLHNALTMKKVKLSFLSSLIGKLSFAAMVLPGARPFMRRMLDFKHQCYKTLQRSKHQWSSHHNIKHNANTTSNSISSHSQRSERREHFRASNTSVWMMKGFKLDVKFWIDHLQEWNGTQRWRASLSDPICFASDASLDGFGFYVEHIPNTHDSSAWPVHMQVGSAFSGIYSSCHRELHSSSGCIQWCELFASMQHYPPTVTY
jgi:hypothetical protein